MCRLIESIKVIDRKFENISFHNQRCNEARAAVWNCKNKIDISHEVALPDDLSDGLYKCRILYSSQIEKTEFIPYQLPNIHSLQVIYDDTIEYPYKFEDRSRIEELFAKRKRCDDILIVKNGCVTDTSFCNILLYDGVNYFTPDTPLLNGTKRRQLISQRKIFEKKITLNDLMAFQKIFLVNAMIDLQDEIFVDIENVNLT
jgi:4-amino-4-deoxychorismate lyase